MSPWKTCPHPNQVGLGVPQKAHFRAGWKAPIKLATLPLWQVAKGPLGPRAERCWTNVHYAALTSLSFPLRLGLLSLAQWPHFPKRDQPFCSPSAIFWPLHTTPTCSAGTPDRKEKGTSCQLEQGGHSSHWLLLQGKRVGPAA